MSLLAIVFAAALSAGNAEFDRAAQSGAAEVSVRRIAAELAEKGPKSGTLADAMLAGGEKFAAREQAKELCRGVFEAAVEREFAEKVKGVRERLGIASERESTRIGRIFTNEFSFAEIRKIRENSRSDSSRPEVDFDKVFEAERAAACAEQAKGIAGAVKPTEQEIESKDEAALAAEMTAKVAAQQKGGVFEENLKYISETIVAPVIASGRKEMKRQREYLTRTKCEAYAPSALGAEIEANLRRNVAERTAKETDPAEAWGVFERTLAEGLPAAVEKRTLERVAKNVDDVAVKVEPGDILKTIVSDPAAHRKADDSEKVFRGVFAAQVLDGALGRAAEEAPAKERQEFAEYVRAHAASPEIVRAVEARVKRELLPKWRAAREAAAKAEAARIWPHLADRTWYPDADFADRVAARSDYAAAVKGWRTAPEMSSLAEADGGKPLMEETSAEADGEVAAAFDLARSAIAAQNALVDEAEPEVLGEAKDRKSSFWRATPDLKAIVGMLTGAVEDRWESRRAATLWGEGERPANADAQHAALFPSVKRRIELVARQILEEMEKPEPDPEEKPEPEEPPPEDPTESDQTSEEPPLMMFSIVVEREGDEVSVKLDQGKTTVAERRAKAKMSDYRDAMKYVSDKLGTDILKLK